MKILHVDLGDMPSRTGIALCKVIAGTLMILNSVQCTTPTGGTSPLFDPAKAVMVIDITVPSAVRIAVSKEPAAAKWFGVISSSIDIFANSETFDDVAFHDLIVSSGSASLTSPEALAVIDTITALYKGFYADVVKQGLDKHNLTPVLKAISTDIQKGLKK